MHITTEPGTVKDVESTQNDESQQIPATGGEPPHPQPTWNPGGAQQWTAAHVPTPPGAAGPPVPAQYSPDPYAPAPYSPGPYGPGPQGWGPGWEKPRKSWGLGDAFAGLGIGIAASAVLSIGGMLIAFLLSPDLRATLSSDPDQAIMDVVTHPATLLSSLVGLWAGFLGAPLWASYRKGRKSLKDDFGLAFTGKDIWTGILLGLGLRILEVGIFWALGAAGVDLSGADNSDIISAQETIIGLVLIGAAAAIGAPFFEELFFRGLWLRALLKKGLPTGVAILISSALFGLLHTTGFNTGGLQLILLTGALGALLAVVTLKTGRLGCSITAHATFNLTAVLLVTLT